jgi:hypothetical protein
VSDLSWNSMAFFQCTLLASHTVTDGNGIFEMGKLVVSMTDTVGLLANLCQLMAERYIVPDAATVHRTLHSNLEDSNKTKKSITIHHSSLKSK